MSKIGRENKYRTLNSRHAIGLVQNDNLMSTALQSDLLLSEHLDLVSDNVDASIIRCVHLEDSLLVDIGAQKLSRETENRRGLSGARRTRDDQIGQVTFLAEHFQPVYSLFITDYILQIDRAVFLDPWQCFARLFYIDA